VVSLSPFSFFLSVFPFHYMIEARRRQGLFSLPWAHYLPFRGDPLAFFLTEGRLKERLHSEARKVFLFRHQSRLSFFSGIRPFSEQAFSLPLVFLLPPSLLSNQSGYFFGCRRSSCYFSPLGVLVIGPSVIPISLTPFSITEKGSEYEVSHLPTRGPFRLRSLLLGGDGRPLWWRRYALAFPSKCRPFSPLTFSCVSLSEFLPPPISPLIFH